MGCQEPGGDGVYIKGRYEGRRDLEGSIEEAFGRQHSGGGV